MDVCFPTSPSFITTPSIPCLSDHPRDRAPLCPKTHPSSPLVPSASEKHTVLGACQQSDSRGPKNDKIIFSKSFLLTWSVLKCHSKKLQPSPTHPNNHGCVLETPSLLSLSPTLSSCICIGDTLTLLSFTLGSPDP